MGVSGVVARAAVRRAHVLLVTRPGWDLTRMAAEAAVRRRGWRLATSPADADVLLLAGDPGPVLGDLVERLWDQLPGPRARVLAHRPDDAVPALDEATRLLLDSDHQRDDAHRRATTPQLEDGDGDGDGDMEMDHGDGDGDGDGDMEMDHGDMEMRPGGIALAEGADDRDGLEMDVLHLRLGPVLPHWPAGLVLSCTLQGDVIIEASAELVDADTDAPAEPAAEPVPDARTLDAVRRCDRAARLLALAGWEDAADRARTVRDALLGGHPRQAAAAGLERLRRQVRRSWPLRWSLRGLAPLTAADVQRLGLPAELAGDTFGRLTTLLDAAAAAMAGQGGAPGAAGLPVDAIADAVTGIDLATARLVVAGLDVEPLTTGRERVHA